MKKILIICRHEDQHVNEVIKHLNKASQEFIVWDLSDTLSFTHTINFANIDKEFNYKSIWWRYKSSINEYQGKQSSIEAFRTREWLASLRAFSLLTSNILWINNPVLNYACNLKVSNLFIAKKLGFNIPATIVTNSSAEADNFYNTFAKKGVIYKPLTYYYEYPDFATFTTLLSKEKLENFKNQISNTPIILQELIQKDYELRITIIQNKIFSIKINSNLVEDGDVDWRKDQLRHDLYEIYDTPDEFCRSLLKLHNYLGLVYGAYDFIVDKQGNYIFLEVNPGGQWLWLEKFTGIEITKTLADTLIDCN